MPTAGEYKHEPFGIPCQCFIKRRARQFSCMKSCLRADATSCTSHCSSFLSSGDRRNSNGECKKVTFSPILTIRKYDDETISDTDTYSDCKFFEEQYNSVESCSSLSSPSTDEQTSKSPRLSYLPRFSITIRQPENENISASVETNCLKILSNEVNITVECIDSPYDPSRVFNISSLINRYKYSTSQLASDSSFVLDSSNISTSGEIWQHQQPSNFKENMISQVADGSKDSETNYQKEYDDDLPEEFPNRIFGCERQWSDKDPLDQSEKTNARYSSMHQFCFQKLKCANVRKLIGLSKGSIICVHLGCSAYYKRVIKLLKSQKSLHIISGIIFWTGCTFLIVLGYLCLYPTSPSTDYS